MLVLGHIAAAGVATRWFDQKADLRWVLFFGLIADLVDKPIGLIVFRESLNSGRVYCHSLLVNLLLTLALLSLGKPLVYSLALWIHQLADLMWTRPWVALWPFTGAFGYRDMALEQWMSLTLSPYHLAAETAAVVIIAIFAVWYRLVEPTHLARWIRTGILPPCRFLKNQKNKTEIMGRTGKDTETIAF